MQVYNKNLSVAGSSVDVPLDALILTAEYSGVGSIRLSVRPKTASTSVLADIRRTTIYGGGTIEVQTFNNTTITARTVIDDLVYDQSDETHWTRFRIQDPATLLWSMCEVETFASNLGARPSLCVNWFYTGASF